MHSDDVGKLLSLISHEVRAPLGVMRGYLRLLDQHAALSDPHRQAVASAMKAGDRATEILNQVSALAKLQRGEIALSLGHTELEPLLRSAAAAVPLPDDPAVTVHVKDTPKVMVMADAALLRSAVTGLITAVVRAQAMDARVYLLTREEPREDERGVIVTITAMEALRATHHDGPLNIGRGGLGLELPISAFIVDAHRGEIAERSEENRFVGVVLWLPIVT